MMEMMTGQKKEVSNVDVHWFDKKKALSSWKWQWCNKKKHLKQGIIEKNVKFVMCFSFDAFGLLHVWGKHLYCTTFYVDVLSSHNQDPTFLFVVLAKNLCSGVLLVHHLRCFFYVIFRSLQILVFVMDANAIEFIHSNVHPYT
jgi:hypothetical protein